MKHQKITPLQREWLEWLLTSGWDWLNYRINATSNHQRINWTYVNGIYDVATRQLLNFLLTFFNRDKEAQRSWREFLKHKVK